MTGDRSRGDDCPMYGDAGPASAHPAGPSPGAATDELSLPVAAVARRLGVAPATLRTWARRYGLEPSGHVPGSHRRYTTTDLARLQVMHRALTHGSGPAEAARLALTTPLEALPTVPAPRPAMAPRLDPAPDPHVPARSWPAATGLREDTVAAELDDDRPGPAAGRGGRVLRLPGATPRARGLARAASAMDAEGIRAVLLDSVTADGLVVSWDQVARPVLVAVAQRWESTGRGVEIEHLVSDCVTAVFNARAVLAPARAGLRPVLLAGMPREQHVLPLTVLAAVLAERGIPCRPLGADLPADALADAVRRTAPAAVVLWSQVPETADADVVTGLPRTRPRHRLLVGGVGWDETLLPPAITRLSTLVDAADLLTRVATS